MTQVTTVEVDLFLSHVNNCLRRICDVQPNTSDENHRLVTLPAGSGNGVSR